MAKVWQHDAVLCAHHCLEQRVEQVSCGSAVSSPHIRRSGEIVIYLFEF